MTEWKPIETAPKDGTPILLLDRSAHYGREPKGVAWLVATWRAYESRDCRHPGGSWDAFYGPCSASNPTHWMGIPGDPSVNSTKENKQ